MKNTARQIALGILAGITLGACALGIKNSPPKLPYEVPGALGPIRVRVADLNPGLPMTERALDSAFAAVRRCRSNDVCADTLSSFTVYAVWRPMHREIVIDLRVNPRMHPFLLAHERCHAALLDARLGFQHEDSEEALCSAIGRGFQK